MNKHYEDVVNKIRSKEPRLKFSCLLDDFTQTDYFSSEELNVEELSNEARLEFKRLLQLRLEEAIDTSKLRRNLLLISVPLLYFLGSILRDIVIDYNNSIGGSTDNWLFWALWVMVFLGPLGPASNFHDETLHIKDYIKIELGKTNNSMGINDEKSFENVDSLARLKEIEKLYEEGLINKTEYDRKRKTILDEI